VYFIQREEKQTQTTAAGKKLAGTASRAAVRGKLKKAGEVLTQGSAAERQDKMDGVEPAEEMRKKVTGPPPEHGRKRGGSAPTGHSRLKSSITTGQLRKKPPASARHRKARLRTVTVRSRKGIEPRHVLGERGTGGGQPNVT